MPHADAGESFFLCCDFKILAAAKVDYRLDPATGGAEVIQVQPVRGAFPRNINLAPGGGWLLAAGADSNTVAVHRVDPATGRLTYQTKGVIQTPAPICIVFARP